MQENNVSTLQVRELFRNYCDYLLDQCRGAGPYTITENIAHLRKLVTLGSRLYPEAEELRQYEREAERLLDEELKDVEEALAKFRLEREIDKEHEASRCDGLAHVTNPNDQVWSDCEEPL